MENKTQIDDGIRLLNEIHEKTKANIVNLIDVKNNNLDGVVIVWDDQINGSGKSFTIKFEINGEIFTSEGSYNRMDALVYQNSGVNKDVNQMIVELVTKAVMDALAKSSPKGSVLPHTKRQSF